MLGIDATIVDAGFGTDRVYNFCRGRLAKRVFPGKGMAGARPAFQASKSKTRNVRIAIVGTDTIKTSLLTRLTGGQSIRFSDSLEPVWFEQLCSERRVVRYSRGQPTFRFERRLGMAAEGLDCTVYAWSAFSSLQPLWDNRATELRAGGPGAAKQPAVIRSRYLERAPL